MLPDRVSNPGSLTYESGALPIALRGPAKVTVNALAAGCESFYRKIYGHFLQCGFKFASYCGHGYLPLGCGMKPGDHPSNGIAVE